MAPPQLISDFMSLMLLLAPSAAIICLVLAGLSLRQGSIPDALVGSTFAKWMFWAVVFLTLPQLISWFPSFGVPAPLPGGGIGTGWMANLQTDVANFVQNFVLNRLALTFAAFFVALQRKRDHAETTTQLNLIHHFKELQMSQSKATSGPSQRVR
jgi:hypothetical protein